jgi:hypothetical protein
MAIHSPLDATLDSDPHDEPGQDACARVALVEGSAPRLSGETHSLLRTRLRAAATVLLIGFSSFFLASIFLFEPPPYVHEIRWLQLAVIVTLALSVAVLFRICPRSLGLLRLCEIVIFAAPAIFFLFLQPLTLVAAADEGYCINPTSCWMLLTFTYAIFIPNSWQRASAVVAVFSLAPIVILTVVRLRYPTVAQVVDAPRFFEVSMVMALTGTTAVYGVYLIGALRREAFEARQLGQYRLTRLLGSGGMGEVYLAEHQMLKRPCAIKIIRPSRAGDPQALARFEREVMATARLSHWNTIEIFDYGRTADGTFYYVMEYLPGLSFDQLVEKHGPLTPARVIYLLRQVCDGLREAHRMGLVHRDLKPSNLVAAERGGIYDVAKIVDFGLVKPILEKLDAQLTADGSITGSPLYLSPEQAMGGEPDFRSDLYSLGAVTYYLLTGQPPFVRERTIQVLLAHAHDEVVPPSRVKPGVPDDLEEVVLRLLAKSPEQRFQDVESLEKALADCRDDGGWNRDDATRWWESHGTTELPAEREACEPALAPSPVKVVATA